MLLECVGTLFDDPLHSDVQFVVPKKYKWYAPTKRYYCVPITFNPVRSLLFPSRECIHSFLVLGSGFMETSADVNIGHPRLDLAFDSTSLANPEDSDGEEQGCCQISQTNPASMVPSRLIFLKLTFFPVSEKPVTSDSVAKHSEWTPPTLAHPRQHISRGFFGRFVSHNQ